MYSMSMSKEDLQQLVAQVQTMSQGKSWIELSNALFSIGGIISGRFTTHQEREEFTKTEEWQTIRNILSVKEKEYFSNL